MAHPDRIRRREFVLQPYDDYGLQTYPLQLIELRSFNLGIKRGGAAR